MKIDDLLKNEYILLGDIPCKLLEIQERNNSWFSLKVSIPSLNDVLELMYETNENREIKYYANNKKITIPEIHKKIVQFTYRSDDFIVCMDEMYEYYNIPADLGSEKTNKIHNNCKIELVLHNEEIIDWKVKV